MAKTLQPSRPTLTDDLVQRLGSDDTDPKEMKALEALSKEMIKVFRDECRLSYVREAAALARFTTASNYQDLSRAFNNAIIGGTADGNILEPQLLERFAFVLRCAEGTKTAEVELGPVMKSLQVRLNSAVEQAEPKSQYQLIYTLSSVLDAMIDIKTIGLSREKLHEPLLKQLATLSKEQELRLSQAAGYAYQALLGIPNDEGPYQTLWRHTSTVVEGTANVTGAVFTMDPAKLFDGLVKLQDLPRLISSMIDVVRAVSGLANSLGDTADGVRFVQNQKSWYVALRFTDMLIQAKAFKSLEDFLSKVSCSKEKEFLCGIFAQLEQAWETGDPSFKGQIVDFLERVLVPAGSESPYPRVFEWVKLVAHTLGRSDWMDSIQPARRSWHRRLWKHTPTASTIPCLKTPDEALPADLLKQAWLSCIEAQVYYADVKIREYYVQDERRLKVERLSGKPLSMDQCYINLAIAEHSSHRKQSDTKHQSSPFSLLARLKVETPHQDSQVSLASLFNPRKRRDGTTAPPERIFIRGQAGVGKTTLCKKIVYDNLYDGTWADSFSRLLWVPLRTLKGKSSLEYNLKDWLRAEYFRAGDGDILAEAVRQAVDYPDKYGKTLFILDGLDEVSHELDSETSGLLQDLLNQPHAIITSRPGTSMARFNNVDLELEIVGFYPEQVQTYIKKAAPDKAREIDSFLQDRWLLQGLVRIPIQLEALCYSWDAGTANSGGASTTMTTLYRAIERKLWKKDVVRLRKTHGGMPLSVDIAKSTLDTEISSWVMPEVNLLRCLAFTGLYSNVIDLDKKCQEQVWSYWNDISEHLKPRGTPPSSHDLARLSFLRSSDTSSDKMERSYHFLHLTFQEYFAAQYFVEHWKSGNQIPCLALISGEIDRVNAEDFLSKEKYNARYDIFWRFVAGLLQPHGDGEQLCRFFGTIEKEPRDLLGPTHQRLVMHCLSELMSQKGMPTFAPLRTKLEDQMSKWLLFECNFRGTARLASEMEFPEQVLHNFLQRESEDTVMKVLKSLRGRPKIPLSIIELATDWLRGNASRPFSVVALRMLQRPQETLPDQTLEAVVSWFEDQDRDIRQAAVEALEGQLALPENILKAVVARLEDKDNHIKWIAVHVLKPAQLEDQDEDVKYAAAQVLESQLALPEEFLKSMAAQIEHQDESIRGAAIEILRGRPALPEEILKAVAAQFMDQDGYIREAALLVLEVQSALPKEILRAIAIQLEDRDGDVRRRAVQVLRGQSVLPEEILNAVTARLWDQDADVRWAAVRALDFQSVLPEEILNAVATRLGDQDAGVREEAIQALGIRLPLPEEILKAVVARLEDQDGAVRRAALGALRDQLALPKEILEAVLVRLEDQNRDMRWKAVQALKDQSALPEEILKAVAGQLKDQDKDIRRAAVEALGSQLALPQEILQAVTARLEDQDISVRRAVVDALGGQSALPKDILQAVVAQLEDQDMSVRQAVVDALGGQLALPKEVLGQFAKSIYPIWLEKSFREHFSCYVANGICYIDMPVGLREVRLEDQQDRFKGAIREAQRNLGIPLPDTSGMERWIK
ncbi:hypothetical protein BKA56DRAFT_677610 [Ilyonectria sp. MPI-CAGE-AT-0026]|nr:hypothetical protein BKA56DRAFT_677610 [Ilyonectria sp. MPI-CAGE-AT-0026]